MSPTVSLIILLISSVWTILILRSAIVTMHSSGKTREELENVKKGYSFIQRLFLLNVKDASAGNPKLNLYRHNIEKFLFGYIIALFTIWILVIISILAPGMRGFVFALVIIKLVLADIGILGVFAKFNTVIDKKNKTISWKWAKK